MMVLPRCKGIHHILSRLLLLLPLVGTIAQAQIPLDLENDASIKSAAKILAGQVMGFYSGNLPGQTLGKFPFPPYYWWESGAAWGAMIDYWHYTGDSTWNDMVSAGLLWQSGEKFNYMPTNESKSLGNDDQCFWGLAVMAAAEKKFPDPPAGQPQWLALAQAVFNTQAKRWETGYCNGGLRWQIYNFNKGYEYKNSISNGCFFQLAARLARYTNNDLYKEWAEKAYDWTVEAGLLTDSWDIIDGVDVARPAGTPCQNFDNLLWTYNSGIYIAGSAYLYNYTSDAKWKQRLDKLIEAASGSFYAGSKKFDIPGEKDVMVEIACENNANPTEYCDVDQRSFKAYLARFMILTVKMVPYTYDLVMPKIRASALAAARLCKGAPTGTTCSLKWATGEWKPEYAEMGEQMAALEVVQSTLVDKIEPPVTASKGGTSQGNPDAGLEDITEAPPLNIEPVKTGDRVGAGFLTAVVAAAILGGAWWMMF